jgi:hypothetical protein
VRFQNLKSNRKTLIGFDFRFAARILAWLTQTY